VTPFTTHEEIFYYSAFDFSSRSSRVFFHLSGKNLNSRPRAVYIPGGSGTGEPQKRFLVQNGHRYSKKKARRNHPGGTEGNRTRKNRGL
jgi:hypothetical protein